MEIKYKVDDGADQTIDLPPRYDLAAGATVAGVIIDHEMSARSLDVDDPGAWPKTIVITRAGRVTRYAVSIEPPPQSVPPPLFRVGSHD